MSTKRRAFGSVRKKASGRWEARYRDAAGETHYRYFTTKAQATAHLSTVETDMLRGDWIDPRRATVTVTDLAAEFMASKRKLRPNTAEYYDYLIAHHIKPAFGTWPLARVTTEAVDKWMTALSEKENINASTEVKALRLFSQMMGFAVTRRRIPYNPCTAVETPDVEDKTMLFLSEAQVGALAQNVTTDYGWRAMVLLAAYGGLRWGELVGLPTSHVDPLRGQVRVSQQLLRSGAIGPPKTAAGVRTVRIPKWLCDELTNAIANRAPADDMPEHHRDLLFLTSDGTALVHSSNWNRRYWRPAVTKGLPKHLHGLRFHDLRHTAVAIALETARKTGQPLNAKQLQERMGHGTIRMTLDRYGHLIDGHDDEMVAAMANPFDALAAAQAEAAAKAAASNVVPLRAAEAS